MTNFYTDKKQIINWLDQYKIKNYTLIPDDKYGFVVDVSGDINLTYKKLDFIPVKFNKVIGDFYCNHNQLKSLEFCPQEVGDNFYCNNNQLKSLEFSPQIVDGSFNCDNNNLTFLESSPQTVNGSFNCDNNNLTSLEFCPQTVGSNFYCHDNSELKEIQEITDFKQIYLEHKKTLITKFSNKLNKKLPNENSKKSTKIKI